MKELEVMNTNVEIKTATLPNKFWPLKVHIGSDNEISDNEIGGQLPSRVISWQARFVFDKTVSHFEQMSANSEQLRFSTCWKVEV